MRHVTNFNPQAINTDITKTMSYQIREKLNNNIALSREEKNYITTECNYNSFFKDSIPVMGWRVYFGDVLNTYVVRQYGRWQEYKAIDKTSLRHTICGRVEKILQVD